MMHKLPDTSSWTEDWPQEEGYYLFVGGMHGSKDSRLSLVRVGRSGDGVLMYLGSWIMYPSEGTRGFWSPKLDVSSVPFALALEKMKEPRQ